MTGGRTDQMTIRTEIYLDLNQMLSGRDLSGSQSNAVRTLAFHISFPFFRILNYFPLHMGFFAWWKSWL